MSGSQRNPLEMLVGYVRRHLPSRGLCCLVLGVLLLNLLSLYLLHTSPSRWMHAHGGVMPRRHVPVVPAPLPGAGGEEEPRVGVGGGGGGWDRLGNARCRPLRFVAAQNSVEEEEEEEEEEEGEGGGGGGERRLAAGRRKRRRRRRKRMRSGAALASVPGSGNTWLRHLLQQATGYLTGSVYDDAFLRASGFPGEGIANGSVLVVKTHSADPDVRRHFRSVVLLVRKPRNAILAEFNRRHGGHLGNARPKDFQQDWKSFAVESARHWATFNTEWLHYTGPLHIVRYEDLQRDLNATLAAVLRFLNVPVSAEDLACAVQHPGHAYKRRWKGKADEEEEEEEEEKTKKKKKKKKKMAGDFSDTGPLFSKELLGVLGKSERQFDSALKEYLNRVGVTTVS
ncbi:uncharacterized protein LOC143288124 [Babylonia areolata]|uniref:uncharacterized protein LOC143288124 n=1 Tax=Babylonia areolata TaxID=304850 RepID=UPI003FD3CAF0